MNNDDHCIMTMRIIGLYFFSRSRLL